MTPDERTKYVSDIFDECKKLLENKGHDYSGNDDALHNFKLNAERLGLTKYQVWLVYYMKHIDSIINAIKDNPEYPSTASEPLETRIHDAVNYTVLLGCLLYEDGKEDGETRKGSEGALRVDIQGPTPKRPGEWQDIQTSHEEETLHKFYEDAVDPIRSRGEENSRGNKIPGSLSKEQVKDWGRGSKVFPTPKSPGEWEELRTSFTNPQTGKRWR